MLTSPFFHVLFERATDVDLARVTVVHGLQHVHIHTLVTAIL